MQSRAGFFACRFFIGLFMGGFIPVISIPVGDRDLERTNDD